MLASRQEGEPCGQSTIEHCGFCDKGFICSTAISPMIPDQCGICKPERRRSDAVDLTLPKKGTKLVYSYEIRILHYNPKMIMTYIISFNSFDYSTGQSRADV